jgi:serine/threonine-protein kinase PRP4
MSSRDHGRDRERDRDRSNRDRDRRDDRDRRESREEPSASRRDSGGTRDHGFAAPLLKKKEEEEKLDEHTLMMEMMSTTTAENDEERLIAERKRKREDIKRKWEEKKAKESDDSEKLGEFAGLRSGNAQVVAHTGGETSTTTTTGTKDANSTAVNTNMEEPAVPNTDYATASNTDSIAPKLPGNIDVKGLMESIKNAHKNAQSALNAARLSAGIAPDNSVLLDGNIVPTTTTTTTLAAKTNANDQFDMFGDIANTAAPRSNHGVLAGTGEFEDEGNFADADGYYNTRTGELLGGRYRVLGKIGAGVFSTVLKCKDERLANREVIFVRVHSTLLP